MIVYNYINYFIIILFFNLKLFMCILIKKIYLTATLRILKV